MLGELISAGASLLGGIFGDSDDGPENPSEAIHSTAKGARLAGERWGFNPLTLLQATGSGAASSWQSSPNYMGSAIADAGLLLADGLAKRAEEKGEIARLKKHNEELAAKVRKLTLRPVVAGVYAQRESTPALRDNLGSFIRDTSQDHPLDGELGTLPVPDSSLDRANPGYVGGVKWEAVPGFSPGELWEKRYGDTPLNWPIALGQLSADVGYNIHKLQNYAIGAADGSGPVMTVTDQDGKRGEFVLYRPKKAEDREDYWLKQPYPYANPMLYGVP